MKFLKFLSKPKTKSQVLTPERVREYYNEWTDRYIDSFGDTFQSFRADSKEQLFDYLLESSKMQSGQTVIDAGCGVCGPAIYFAQQLPVNIYALTISDYQCQIAISNIKKSQDLKGNIEVKQGDFHQLENYYKENSIDLIYFLESLTHSNKITKVLESCKKVLKQNGRIYIKDLYYNDLIDKKHKSEVDFAVENVNQGFCLNVENIDNFKRIIELSGFKIVFLKLLQIQPNFDAGNHFVANNRIQIYRNQKGLYDGKGVTYLNYYETLLEKI